jgi:proton glutamate symport protein
VSLTARVLVGLAAGFLVGIIAPPIVSVVVAPVGTIFVNLIRVVVLPLVVSMLIASVGSIAGTRALGRTGVRAAIISVVLVALAAIGSLLVAAPVLARVRIDRTAAQTLQPPVTSAAPPAAESPSRAVQWFVDLVPPNVVKAATEDAMLPVIVFSVLFALALARVGEERRTSVLNIAEGIAETMQRLVSWILTVAPIGVFALAVSLAGRVGVAMVAAVVVYIVLVVALTVTAVALLLYPLGIVGGGMTPSAFAAFCAPAQAVAFSSRSSLAALGAALDSVERIGAPRLVSAFIVPLGASVFRFGAAVGQTVGVLFLARLYGVALSVPQLASIVVTVVFATFTVPGIPGGSMIAMVPVLRAVDLPVEGIGILLAVDAIPDMFRTTANLTGTMTLAAVLSRRPAGLKAGRGGAVAGGSAFEDLR